MYSFRKAEIDRKVRELGVRKAMIFGLMTVDRMLPNFMRFSAETGAPGLFILESAIAQLWLSMGDGSFKRRLWTPDHCARLIPDSEEFDNLFTASAADVAGAIANLLEFHVSSDFSLIVEIASLSRDSVDVFLQYGFDTQILGPELDTEILNHPMMQEELRLQATDLDRLGRLSDVGPAELASLQLLLRKRSTSAIAFAAHVC